MGHFFIGIILIALVFVLMVTGIGVEKGLLRIAVALEQRNK